MGKRRRTRGTTRPLVSVVECGDRRPRAPQGVYRTCTRCGAVRRPLISLSRDQGRPVRGDCPVCGAFTGYVRATPEVLEALARV